MENSCPCVPQNVFGSFSFGISDGRAYSMFHVPTCAQRSSPKVSQGFLDEISGVRERFSDGDFPAKELLNFFDMAREPHGFSVA